MEKLLLIRLTGHLSYLHLNDSVYPNSSNCLNDVIVSQGLQLWDNDLKLHTGADQFTAAL